MGVTGWVYANNETGSIPVCTYASELPNQQIDNKLAVCSGSSTGVRIEGYLPAPGTPGTLALAQYTNPQGHHWAVWPALVPNATAAGFSPSGPPIGSVFAAGPPIPAPPNATSYYEGIFTRLTALLGNNLSYYWGWTPEGCACHTTGPCPARPPIHPLTPHSRTRQIVWQGSGTGCPSLPP